MNLARPLKANRAEPALQASAPVVELRGVGLRTVARDAAVALAPGHELGNVVPFSRTRRDVGADRAAPAVVVTPQDRAGAWAGRRAKLWTAFLLCSVAVHAGITFFFHDNAPPMASIGLESISVDIVFGANMAAGLTPDKGEAEASAPTPAMTPQPTPEAPPDPQAADEQKPADAPKAVEPEQAHAEAPPPEKPVEAAAAAPVTPVTPVPNEPATPAPVQAAPSPAPAEAELQTAINPQTEVETVETHVYETAATPAKPEPKVAKPAEDKRETERRERERQRREQLKREHAKREQAKREQAKREEAREKRRAAIAGERNNSRSTRAASTAAGGVGRGRSELNSNYRGIVAAHLARYKQFPAEARAAGQTGTASVTFSLSGSGRVTSSRLARSSGVPSLDREVTAMVRRASPFPPPPDGRPVSFTVPINFQVR
ncbi:MAG: TonB family protein [Variibacter sp.]